MQAPYFIYLHIEMNIRRLCRRTAVIGWLLACPLPAAPMDLLDGPLMQGSLVRGQVDPGFALELDGVRVPVTGDGHFVIAFGRDHPPTATLRASRADEVREQTLRIAPRDYETQRIDGLPKNMVTPSAADLARIRRDQKEVNAARAVRSTLRGFLEPFRWPVHGIITGVYGSRRILNGEPRNPHYGIDIAAPAGTPVRAPASGRVTLAHPDMYYTGATAIIDHGFGVSSTFLHLQHIEVEPGQDLAAGERFATVGSSGRSTGPHLDWRMNWMGTRTDPALLVGPMPAIAEEAP